MGEWYEVTERLALTEDGRCVPESDEAARWLYSIPGRRVPLVEAIRYGLAQPATRERVEAEPEPEPKPAPRRGRPPKAKG